jgi:CBS domain-containing protein
LTKKCRGKGRPAPKQFAAVIEKAGVPNAGNPLGSIDRAALGPRSITRNVSRTYKDVDNWYNVYQEYLAQQLAVEEVAMQVGDVLRKKTSARVVTVGMNETVGVAAKLMRTSNISALVVHDVVCTEGNTAVGMFTERDVVRAIASHGAAGVNLKVSQLISVQRLVACSSTDTLEHVRHLMNVHHIRHLPVIDNFELSGVIGMRDVSAAFDEIAAEPAQTAA